MFPARKCIEILQQYLCKFFSQLNHCYIWNNTIVICITETGFKSVIKASDSFTSLKYVADWNNRCFLLYGNKWQDAKYDHLN